MLKSIDRIKTKTYVGFTINLPERLNKHNNNKGAKSTKGYKWIVIYKKRFKNKNEALSYEYSLKKNRKLRASLLNEHIKTKY
jgi:putative endonuclease